QTRLSGRHSVAGTPGGTEERAMPQHQRHLRHVIPAVGSVLAAVGLLVATAAPAGACGRLVAPNGAVRLDRTTTLAEYHDGVEHYVTSFQYAGGETNFGSIIPLPGVPSDVERAGGWTLQRLEKEVQPPEPVFAGRN